MANSTVRQQDRPKDNVQDVEVRRVQGQNESAVSGAGRDWRLSFTAVRVHNSHLQTGVTAAKGCAVCGEGLEGALAAIEVVHDKVDEVAQGDGADEGADATSPSGGWTSY